MSDSTAVPLSPDIARLIRSSTTPLLERRVQFHAEFHHSLQELMPETPVMSTPVGEQVSQSLVNCVLWAVFATEPVSVVGLTLQGVGLEVHRLGFPREGYQSVVHALLRTLRGIYSVDWSGEMSSAWIGYHAWLCEHWLTGAHVGVLEDAERAANAPPPPPVEAEPDDDDLDDEGLSYGEIMVSMTLGGGGSSRPSRRREEQLGSHEDDERRPSPRTPRGLPRLP